MQKRHFGMLCNVCIRNTGEPFALFELFFLTVLDFLGFGSSFEVCWRWGKSVLFLPSSFPSDRVLAGWGGGGGSCGPFPCSAHPELPCRGSPETSAGPGSGCCGLQEGPKISEPWDNPPSQREIRGCRSGRICSVKGNAVCFGDFHLATSGTSAQEKSFLEVYWRSTRLKEAAGFTFY